jgi:hypothetical protein
MRVLWILFGFLIFAGCDQPVRTPTGAAGNDFQSVLQSMSKVRVTYSGMTDLHTSLKQSSIDPGAVSDLWMPRKFVYENTDSAYTITWQDSQFSTKACFLFGQLDPWYELASDCGTETLIRGTCNNSTLSLSSLVCEIKALTSFGQGNFQTESASLTAPTLELEKIADDSVSFVVKNFTPGSVALGYWYKEVEFVTFIREMQLSAYDTLGVQYPQACRVVFYPK